MLSAELITKMATVKSLKVDVSSVSPSSERWVSKYAMSAFFDVCFVSVYNAGQKYTGVSENENKRT